jgi:alpha-galactosidase
MSNKVMRRLPCILIALAILAAASGVAEAADKKKLKVFILAGQSNMEGHAKIATFDYIGDDPKTSPMLDKMRKSDGSVRMVEDTWISDYRAHEADDPNGEGLGQLTAGYGSRGDASNLGEKIGPELTFGIYMQEALQEPILIIKTSWGGKSLFLDFRPPSAGTYELSEAQVKRIEESGDDLEAERARKKEQSGHYYRLMLDHVDHVLTDIQRVYPDYDETQGYEISGFVWFQGWNDLVDTGVYPNRAEEGGYDLYSELMAAFIREVRQDLKTPELPFVIGVMGVNGPIKNVSERYRVIHSNFREAMAAPAALNEFQGNVRAVRTAPYWDMPIDALVRKRDAYNQRVKSLNRQTENGELTSEQSAEEMKKIESDALTLDEEATVKRGASNAEYHYLGCAKTMALIGKAFAEATLELQPKQ